MSQEPHDLMTLLNFTAHDLAENRAGRLTDSQRQRLHDQRRYSLMIGLGINLVLIVASAILIFVGLQNSPILTFLGICLTLVDAGIMGIYARYWMRVTSDINEQVILAHHGKLERVLRPVNKRIITYILRIDGGEMSVTKDVFKGFEHDARYHVYRARYTGMLLSAERM